MNPVYTGAIASQKKDYRFKIGTIGEEKPEDWIVVEGQHEPVSYTHLGRNGRTGSVPEELCWKVSF